MAHLTSRTSHALLSFLLPAALVLPAATLSGCGEGSGTDGGGSDNGESGETTNVDNPLTNPEDGPPAGNNPGGGSGTGGGASGGSDVDCPIPAEAGLGDVSSPTTVIGDGTKESCTSAAVVSGVAKGGVITFNCGDEPVVIQMEETAKIVNDTGPEIVIDGGGKVTLSGGGARRILYMNTCDQAQKWTSETCENQETPRLTVQNLTFVDGNASAEGVKHEGGGGAIWVRGGRFKVLNSRFFNNVCAAEGQDVGGGALRVFSQYEQRPIYVVNSTFGGEDGLGNSCSNGGAISSIFGNWTIINSLFSYNTATGHGANPAKDGTEGGGSGGAIYNDGNLLHLKLCGTKIEENTVNEHGAAIFFVSNDHKGIIDVEHSTIQNNHGGSWYVQPGISMHDDTTFNVDADSVVSE